MLALVVFLKRSKDMVWKTPLFTEYGVMIYEVKSNSIFNYYILVENSPSYCRLQTTHTGLYCWILKKRKPIIYQQQ